MKTKLDDKDRSDRETFEGRQPRFVKFYGKVRPVEEVKRIKPLVVGRRINADSWKLYERAVWKLSGRGVLVAETEETLELLGEVEKPLIGRKLLKLIKFLYAKKFHQVDLRKKPTLWEVLKQPSVSKLDLGGWGRYALVVYEVLLELGLIDETTEVKFPKVEPCGGGGQKSNFGRIEINETDKGQEEGKDDLNLIDLLFGEEGTGKTDSQPPRIRNTGLDFR